MVVARCFTLKIILSLKSQLCSKAKKLHTVSQHLNFSVALSLETAPLSGAMVEVTTATRLNHEQRHRSTNGTMGCSWSTKSLRQMVHVTLSLCKSMEFSIS